MTEAEALEVLSSFALNNTATYFTMFVSFSFAYFLSARLSTNQGCGTC